jgi:hypothetical protein
MEIVEGSIADARPIMHRHNMLLAAGCHFKITGRLIKGSRYAMLTWPFAVV